MSALLLQLLRFSAVGLACLGLGAAILVALHDLAGVNYLVAYVASFVATNVAGYLCNARFTFAAGAMGHGGAVRYMTVNAALLCINTAALKLLVDGLHIWYLAAAILVGAMSTPVSFLAQRVITYRQGIGSRGAGA